MTFAAYEANLRDNSAEAPETFVDIKSVVRGINKRAVRIEEASMEIGDYVLEEVFQGSLDEALSRNPYKSRSLRQVADDPELIVDRRRLATSVRAAAFRRDLRGNQVECSSLTYSQWAALLKETDDKKRRDLAAEANRERWTVRQITERINATKQGQDSAGKTKDLLRKMEQPLALLKDQDALGLLSDPKKLEEQLKSADRLQMARVIDEVVEKLTQSSEILRKARKSIARIELGVVQPEQG
jgi:hypothetical protein